MLSQHRFLTTVIILFCLFMVYDVMCPLEPYFTLWRRREIPADEYEYVLRKIHHSRQTALVDDKKQRDGK